MNYITLYVMIGLLVSAGIFVFLPRRAILLLALNALALGIAAPLVIWSYANTFVQGDRSAYGMLGTLMVILFAPSGVALTFLGLIKSD